jgi:hypothetical protein
VRDDELAWVLDGQRWTSPVPVQPAADFQKLGLPSVPGHVVADRYGLLAHYTQWRYLPLIIQAGAIRAGCWLTPTPYAQCMVPHNLGLDSPREVCLLVEVRSLATLWGPGTTPASGRFPLIWRGGGIEFYSADPVPFSAVREVIELAPCGDELL